MTSVSVLPTGTANLASVLAGLRRAGATPHLVTSSQEILAAERLVVPGVGHFATAVETLRARGWDRSLQRRLLDGRPALAICLGLQVLFETSDEAPGIEGLGLFSGRVELFPPTVRAPHLGWTRVSASGGVVTAGYASFAHSFRVTEPPTNARCSWAEHGGPFVAAFETNGLLACQFHPELSGTWGADLLARWLSFGGDPCLPCA
jgi:imidazole glycerol phosphate synthase glutamine amidotransferase subunit